MEDAQQKMARLRALRERRDGTPEQQREQRMAHNNMRMKLHAARQDAWMRNTTAHIVQQLGGDVPESVQRFIKGE